ncbi:unnamed protein product [Adineta ricciae]|uniref:Uncharacterized protein n=1 Tax=Adineta ricciae TaxID=249248 RepID=A0A815I0X7_ADIRI|nr:unnamed protein product [Adineta ricciae]
MDGKFSIAWHATRVDRNGSTGLARTYSHVRVTMKGWVKVCGRSKGVNYVSYHSFRTPAPSPTLSVF